ncbi:GDSL-type esterase/lipase family protein [Curtobacterium sp. Leaf261]|uniref:GDSL-type esterase/lipase family protein n=1 Tax=Curtobacterium sp. Leaf261 TaxID=1736311 RepID=UPI0007016A81|nr:GDSL-type esterase/lipase family protein [Curtobacterium sp. Leaf261]KQO59722.1 hypothetical protein ASF23_15630 [Curtobacterium sp. Leaf261]
MSRRQSDGRRPRAFRSALIALPVVVVLAAAGCSSSGPAPTSTPTTSSTPADPLGTWDTALADRTHAAANWVAVGDSLSEGQGASARSDRWIDLTLADLRAANPTTGAPGGVGYLPAQFAVYAPDSTWGDWSTAHSGDSAFDDTIPDLGYRALSMQAGATRTYRFTGTDLDIWWTRYQGSGEFTYAIDDGATKSVDTDGSDSASQLTAVHGLSSGEHSVTITAKGAFDLQGLTVRNGDRGKGITLFDATHSGATVALFTKDTDGFLGAMRRAAPDLVTITLGGNDAQVVTAAEFRSRYTAFVRRIQALPTKPSVLVIGEQQPSATELKTVKSSWSAYERAMRSVASTTGSAYVDLASVFPPGDGSTPRKGISTTDQLHPNDEGQRMLAEAVTAALEGKD